MPLPVASVPIQEIDDKISAIGNRHAKRIGDQNGKGDAHKRGADQLCDNQRRSASAFLAAEELLHLVARRNGNECYICECNFRNGAYGYAYTKLGYNLPSMSCQN